MKKFVNKNIILPPNKVVFSHYFLGEVKSLDSGRFFLKCFI